MPAQKALPLECSHLQPTACKIPAPATISFLSPPLPERACILAPILTLAEAPSEHAANTGCRIVWPDFSTNLCQKTKTCNGVVMSTWAEPHHLFPRTESSDGAGATTTRQYCLCTGEHGDRYSPARSCRARLSLNCLRVCRMAELGLLVRCNGLARSRRLVAWRCVATCT